ncbi:MAG TPA: cytochrome P450 [Acidimicrobiales bacterium]|nr:cytochrome P450 [Acidimicrobiales bacterium]
MMTAIGTDLTDPPVVSGGVDGDHLDELRADPIALMRRLRDECGDIGRFRIGGRDVVLLSGADANEFFFRAPEELMDQAEAYPFMTPIFGEGVVFDAPPERRREMLHNQALRDKFMRGHAATIAAEVDGMVAAWGDRGDIDLLEWFAELTIYTSSACLIGRKFRRQLDPRFAALYHDLEQGTDAIAYVDPYAPIDSFRRRDQARVGLVALVQVIMDGRAAADAGAGAAAAAGPDTAGGKAGGTDGREDGQGDKDLLDVLMSVRNDDGSARFSADEVTGMFISMMFAGHHTTSGTAAWTLIELLRHPDELAAVTAELDQLYADGSEVSYQALREMPRLESAIKEALRLHPPLILVLRVAKDDLAYGGYRIRPGSLVGATPAVSNRIPEDFPDPDAFVPTRYLDPRVEDRANPWTWIPFGAGRHRCVGAPFAMMQLKAIFSVLLRGWEFELAQPPASYRNDHSKMVVQLQQPCLVRYRRRGAGADEPGADGSGAGATAGAATSTAGEPVAGAEAAAGTAERTWRVVVDRDLCQGHAVCESEAPAVFSVSKKGELTVLVDRPPDDHRAAVERAVRDCPTHALRIETAGVGVGPHASEEPGAGAPGGQGGTA